MMENGLVLIVLLWWAMEDVKYKSIKVKYIVGVGVLATVYGIGKWVHRGVETEWGIVVVGAIFVVILLAMSLVFKSMGVGDVAVLVMLMFVKGVVFAVCTLVGAVVVLSIVAAGLIISRRIRRNESVAFVPYISMAALGVMFCV